VNQPANIPCVHVDVFSNRLFYGNPLAVFVLPEHPQKFAKEQLQRIANWTNLSETTFAYPIDDNQYALRIFTPLSELAFAGHPSLGTAAALHDLGLLANASHRYLQHCAAGILPISLEAHGHGLDALPRQNELEPRQNKWFVQAPSAQITILDAQARIELEDACLADTKANPIAVINNGPAWAVAEFEDDQALLAMQPDLAALAHWNRRYRNIGLAAFARNCELPRGLEVRCFVPIDGISEDPVTGSGNAAIAAYLHHFNLFCHGKTPSTNLFAKPTAPDPRDLSRNYQARQGRAIGRDGYLQMRVANDGVVQIGGAVQVVMRGSANLGALDLF
jgi:PhzF family phenazine biosynthesis protein